jgi:hypothetical protein
MDPIPNLHKFTGNWRGTNTLIMSPKEPHDTAPSTLTIASALRGTFIHIDQAWLQTGKPQEGSMLVGYEPDSHTATVHWIDSFHNGRRVMGCTGSAADDGTIDVRGTYPAPPGPDWGWRIILRPAAPDRFEIEMYNVDPVGLEELAVHAVYSRGG